MYGFLYIVPFYRPRGTAAGLSFTGRWRGRMPWELLHLVLLRRFSYLCDKSQYANIQRFLPDLSRISDLSDCQYIWHAAWIYSLVLWWFSWCSGCGCGGPPLSSSGIHEWLGLSQLIWLCQVVGSLKNMKLYSNLKLYLAFKEKGILESKNENVEDSKLL